MAYLSHFTLIFKCKVYDCSPCCLIWVFRRLFMFFCNCCEERDEGWRGD